MALMHQEESKKTDTESKRNERKKRSQLRLQNIQERIKKDNIKLYKTSDIIKTQGSWDTATEYKLFETNWKTPTHYDKCNLCHSKVSSGYINDHLNNICPQQQIKCHLCNTYMKRNELISHWNDATECDGYIISCGRCNNAFNNKNEFIKHQHNESYPQYGEEIKYKWFFNTDNNDTYKQLFCQNKSAETRWICNKCHQRCDIDNNEANEHHCIDYVTDKTINRTPLLIMRLTCKPIVGSDLIANLIRTQI
eukprot:326458_1